MSNRKNKVHIRISGNKLLEKAETYFYREDQTISIPLEGDLIEAIESVKFVWWDKENSGFTYQLKFDAETETFSYDQVGQEFISTPTSRKGGVQ